jgi:hypothetical protein
MYFSKAIVIEGAFGDGAKISILKPSSFFVWCFKTAILVEAAHENA